VFVEHDTVEMDANVSAHVRWTVIQYLHVDTTFSSHFDAENYNYSYNINLYSAALQCCPGALNSVTYSKT